MATSTQYKQNTNDEKVRGGTLEHPRLLYNCWKLCPTDQITAVWNSYSFDWRKNIDMTDLRLHKKGWHVFAKNSQDSVRNQTI